MNLYKQFGPRSDSTNVWSDLDPNCLKIRSNGQGGLGEHFQIFESRSGPTDYWAYLDPNCWALQCYLLTGD